MKTMENGVVSDNQSCPFAELAFELPQHVWVVKVNAEDKYVTIIDKEKIRGVACSAFPKEVEGVIPKGTESTCAAVRVTQSEALDIAKSRPSCVALHLLAKVGGKLKIIQTVYVK